MSGVRPVFRSYRHYRANDGDDSGRASQIKERPAMGTISIKAAPRLTTVNSRSEISRLRSNSTRPVLIKFNPSRVSISQMIPEYWKPDRLCDCTYPDRWWISSKAAATSSINARGRNYAAAMPRLTSGKPTISITK